ncbi:hypothetical protein A3F34_01495 [Candidatus Roizmanbacteria bacterium RIFCSPHIGHO2_12_FULL_44_10]|uniref:Uncharacterized protein n=1 Tax=Candidatus Roizmanbacteria bacterium RIFCSPHIGHO2_12_FULL_44_10 TaxID=1802054 RepID=A0A1F7I9L8_9BACT|nr:MAG: hypothetical protein A3F34_01495 [Candidatus Roizmanbacteria bacterium RIFCSPHIGHO2_12_FULL_44_10]
MTEAASPFQASPDALSPVMVPRLSDRLPLEALRLQAPERVLEILEGVQSRYGDMYDPVPSWALALPEGSLPHDWRTMSPWFLKQLVDGNIFPCCAGEIPDGWYLMDRTVRPEFQEGQQLYTLPDGSADPIGEEISYARGRSYRGAVPRTSRFDMRPVSQIGVLLPLLADNLSLATDKGERMTMRPYIVMNRWRNLHDLEMDAVDTWERTSDWTVDMHSIVSGHKDHGGVGDVADYAGDISEPNVGFSTLIYIPNTVASVVALAA